jgi:type IV pilus assembly protein PilC
MPKYAYTARDQAGAVQNGWVDAKMTEEVVSILQRRGLLVTSVKEAGAAAKQAPVKPMASRRLHGRVTTEDQVLLCQQLSALVDAGIPLLRSLRVINAQVESRTMLMALEEVTRDVEGGRTFRDALAKHPRVFSNMWLNLVETGEASGHLGQSLRQLAQHFQSANHLQNEVKTALTYPAFLIVMAIGVMIVFIYVVIPKFTGMFEAMNMTLPPLTQALVNISYFARKYWVVLLLGGAGGIWVIRRYFATEAGHWLLDRVVLKLPGLKNLFINVQIAEFFRGMTTLIESGVPLLSGLEIMCNSATNRVYGQGIALIKEYVKEGKTMAQPMEECGLFSPMAIQMVQVGEEIGELGKMMARVAQYYEERVEVFIARMSKLFEPVAIVVMGGLVLIIVLSVFLPIFKMSSGGGSL